MEIEIDLSQCMDIKKHTCPYTGCSAAFTRPYRLEQHLLVHNNVRAFGCNEAGCTKAYTSKSHLDRHINITHRGVEKDVVYGCPRCLQRYVNRQNLKRHMKNHCTNTKKETFNCDRCYEKFQKKHQLSTHMYRHTGIRAFSCKECPREFITLLEKKKHERHHKVYTCTHCQGQFNHWGTFRDHVTTVHVPSEYICDECGRSFKKRNHIVKHLSNVHANPLQPKPERVFPCPYVGCERTYSRNSNLKQHFLTKHENMKHECEVCHAGLSTKAKLHEHIIKIHLNSPYKVKPRTKATGRKTRKDAGIPKSSVALKLAGLPQGDKVLDGKSEENQVNIGI